MTNTKNVKKGDKIRVLYMSGEPNYNGKIGIVEHIDDANQIHGTWGGCAIIPTLDKFEIINEEEKIKWKNFITTQMLVV